MYLGNCIPAWLVLVQGCMLSLLPATRHWSLHTVHESRKDPVSMVMAINILPDGEYKVHLQKPYCFLVGMESRIALSCGLLLVKGNPIR